MGGKPCYRGTRIPVAMIRRLLDEFPAETVHDLLARS
jgi:uncharacterized protein (DUF433 family)